jgi:hypothetical protein
VAPHSPPEVERPRAPAPSQQPASRFAGAKGPWFIYAMTELQSYYFLKSNFNIKQLLMSENHFTSSFFNFFDETHKLLF